MGAVPRIQGGAIKPFKDQAWGLDRYKASPTFGQIVLKHVLLWNEPGPVPIAKNMTGAVRHGQVLTLFDKTVHDGQTWYKGRCVVQHEGKEYVQEGWIPAKLLKERGKKGPWK